MRHYIYRRKKKTRWPFTVEYIFILMHLTYLLLMTTCILNIKPRFTVQTGNCHSYVLLLLLIKGTLII